MKPPYDEVSRTTLSQSPSSTAEHRLKVSSLASVCSWLRVSQLSIPANSRRSRVGKEVLLFFRAVTEVDEVADEVDDGAPELDAERATRDQRVGLLLHGGENGRHQLVLGQELFDGSLSGLGIGTVASGPVVQDGRVVARLGCCGHIGRRKDGG